MKVKILVSVSAAFDGSHPAFSQGDQVEVDEKTGKSLLVNRLAEKLEAEPAVKIVHKGVAQTKKAVK